MSTKNDISIAPENTVYLSVVLPVFNEQECLPLIYDKLKSVLSQENYSHQIIFVDDKSQDDSLTVLKGFTTTDPTVEVICLSRNYGQTAAMSAGIDHAKGKIIITLDADMQNDPADIPSLVEELEKGYDAVSGWRKNRQDAFWFKKVPSWFANLLISKLSGKRIHDHGCTLKAYKASTLKSIRLYGEQHRFIPALICREGGTVTEVVVRHHARKSGYSKYGLERVIKVLLDVFFLKFISGYATRPLHFFGSFGIFSLFLGFITAIITVYYRFFGDIPGLNLTPWLFLFVLLTILGVQMIFIGLLAEISIRTYYESQGITTYTIREKISR